VADLQVVGGNKSFHNTILRISALLEMPSRSIGTQGTPRAPLGGSSQL
jgi:hypothetical protein